MNTYWIKLPCDLLSSLASFQCSLLHHLHLSSDLGLSKYVNQHSHLNLSRNVRLSVLYNLDFNIPVISFPHWHLSSVLFYLTCILLVIWAYPNVNQHFSSKSQSECPSVCPVLVRFQHPSCCFIFVLQLNHLSSMTSFLSQTSFSWCL